MCGIAGAITIQAATPPLSPEEITAMLARIGHRGPDEAGYFVDDQAALANVRLSIVDLGHGQQPMSDQLERFWITYNGEIYNYIELRAALMAEGARFRTDCDTEVILHAWMHWGESCLSLLNGAFAFAIYDRVERRLVLARDRYGKRPLFYVSHGGRFWFASEMKAFLAVPGLNFGFNHTDIASIFACWTPLPNQTGWQNIYSLPMASVLSVGADGSMDERVYERLEFTDCGTIFDEREAAERVRTAIEQSVILRLRSDVPVGIYLSGGLDSAIIAMLAARGTEQTLSTFSVEFADEMLDESAYQHLMSKRLGAKHQGLHITTSDLCDAFPAAVYHAEIPAFRTAFVPMFLLSRLVRDCGVKTVLSGEGADEVFLGYSLFRETQLRRQWAKLSVPERKARIAGLNPYLGHFNEATHGSLMGLYQQYTDETLPGLFSHEMRLQNGRFALRLLKEGADRAFEPLIALCAADPGFAGFGDVQKAQWLEFRTLLAGYLLSTQGERMGLAHGVENRCPFLDPNVVSLSASVNLKFDKGLTEKGILKLAFPDLPEEILARHKHPYRAPDSAAFVAARPDYMELLLSQAELDKADMIDSRFATALTRKIMTTQPDQVSVRENQAFIYLLSLQILRHQFVERRNNPAADLAPIRARLSVVRDERSPV
jgi:asparagine synthase (glutamine-hydrolysing)